MNKKSILMGVLIGLLLGLLIGALYYELYYCERKMNNKSNITKNINLDKASMLINKLGMLPFQIPGDFKSLANLSDEQKTNLVLCSMHKTIDEAEPFLIGCHFGTDYSINDMKKAANSLFGTDDFLYCPYFNQHGEEKICVYGGIFNYNPSFLYHYAKWLNFEEQSDYTILTGQFAIIETNLSEAQEEEQITCIEETVANDCVLAKDNYEDIALYNLDNQKLKLEPLYQGDKMITKNQVFDQFSNDIYIYKFFFKLTNDQYYLEKIEIIK